MVHHADSHGHGSGHLLRLALIFGGALLLALVWYSRPASAPVADCTGTDARAQICAMVSAQGGHLPVSMAGLNDLRRFYAARGYQPAWSGSPDAERQAHDVLALLAHAGDAGLTPIDYNQAQLSTRQSPADFDVTLTDAVLRYAHDVRLGRVMAYERGGAVSLPEQSFDFAGALTAALQTGSVAKFFAEQKPTHPQYAKLESALARYRAIDANGGWQATPAITEKVLEADPVEQRRLLTRLAVEDNSVAADVATVDPTALSAALGRFQTRNGLKADGKLGKDTVLALNISASARIDTIEVNMERWRWMPHVLESRYVMVNVPATELEVIDNGAVILKSRVIAGRPADPSPIIRAEARGIIVNPPWNVPPKIAAREIWPKVHRNPNYLAQHGMVIRENGQIQQLPGPKSALGAVKLDMPNPFMVYLHDTPGRHLFAQDRRNLSHGCIRVQQILPLAAIILGGSEAQDTDEVEAAVASGATRTIAAPRTTAVYFAYWTAFVDDDGTIEFRPDIYGRDPRVLAVLHRSTSTRVTLAANGCVAG